MIKEFLDLSKILNHRDLVIEADEDGNRHAKTSVRIVKGLFLPHYFHPTTQYTFEFIRTRFPTINFHAAEEYQILNYVPGGHYAPHWDYFDLEDNYRVLGNRMITFMVILKTAKIGGGTIFPKMGITFQPKPGDAVIWFNQNPDDSKADDSLHGACPVLKGNKIGLTLWIRSKGQMFSYPCPIGNNKTFDMNMILKPKVENIPIRKYVFV
uniref:Fe2OG dioxygenase domain-containing protein n=1 Tax=Panagrolaimus sp. JU765 TaxID=591449 RepID=A0AC34R8N8_9BILA